MIFLIKKNFIKFNTGFVNRKGKTLAVKYRYPFTGKNFLFSVLINFF